MVCRSSGRIPGSGLKVKVKGQGHQVKNIFFNEMSSSDIAATRKLLMQMKPGFLLSVCRINLYVEFNFIIRMLGLRRGVFSKLMRFCCFFFKYFYFPFGPGLLYPLRVPTKDHPKCINEPSPKRRY